MNIPVVITIEAGLSFLGLGVQPPQASLGSLIKDGYIFLSQSWWPTIGSAVTLALATLGSTLFGEALRDAADPKLKGHRAMSGAAIANLNIDFATKGGIHHAVRNVTLSAGPGRILGLVGESGSGKSTVALALMGLLAANARVTAGALQLGADRFDLAQPQATAALRGRRMAMIFQDPFTSLNPVFSIRAHLNEVLTRRSPELAGERTAAGRRRRAGRRRHRPAGGPPDAVSARAQRRHAPARRHRHGAAGAPRPADRR